MPIPSSQISTIDHIIKSRHSVRAFLDTPVSKQLIREILTVACRAPSGTNTQPWQVYVVQGEKRDKIVQRVCQLQSNPKHVQEYQETFDYYPKTWISPFIDRRRQNGWALYGLLNIKRGEKDKMAQQQLENFKFFNAPTALFFTVNKAMGIGAKMDISMFIQNIMLATKARGLDTCPQAAWNHYHKIVLEEICAPNEEELVCTLALGYADPNHIVNTLKTPREPLENFVTFL